MPEGAKSMKVMAHYKDEEGDQVTTEIDAVPFYSPNDFYVHVTTSTNQGELGNYAVFHLRSNFAFNSLNYVVSKLIKFNVG